MRRLQFWLWMALLCTFAAPSAVATDLFTWTQRTNQGPLTDKSAPRLRTEFIGKTLAITAVIDSTGPSNYLYMRIEIADFSMQKKGFDLTSGTVYQYGARSDQRFKLKTGSATVTNVVHDSNEVHLDFEWYGDVRLQNDVELTIRITNGKARFQLKPELSVVVRPSENVKVKADSKHRVTVYANKTLARDAFVSGATVTITHDGAVFTGEKTVTGVTGSDGSASFDLYSKKELVDGTYTMTVKARRGGYIDSKDSVVSFKVDPTGRYYYSKCKGFPFIQFDAGADEKFEDDGPPFILSSGTSVRMGGIITIPGRVRIDTSGGGAKVYVTTGVKVSSVDYDGSPRDFTIAAGSFTFIAPSCDGILDFAIGELVSAISGGKLKEPKIELIGDPAGNAGLKVGATMELGKNTYDGCNDDLPAGTIWQPNKAGSVSLELGFLTGPTSTSIVASGTLSNFTPAPGWCVNEAKIEYRADSSYWGISGKIKSPLFSEASALVAFMNGGLRTVTVSFLLDRCIPIGQPPNVCWRGGGFNLDNISSGSPTKGSVNAVFGPYDPLKDLYLITIEGGFESSPAKVYGSVKGNLLRIESISEKKPFQAEVTGTVSLIFGESKGQLDVDASLFHLGGDYFYNGKCTLALGLDPVSVSGSLTGSLKLPAVSADLLPKAGTLGRFINKWAPYPLGSVTGSFIMSQSGERKASFSYDFRNLIPPSPEASELTEALRNIGTGTFSVDFTLLPSPAAWDFDGSFNAIITSLVFGGVAGRKPEDRTQATEQVFDVPAGQSSLLILLETSKANPTTTLRGPGGVSYTATDASKGVFVVQTPDGIGTMWVVREPVAGRWTLVNPDASASDTVSVYGVVPPPTMALSATVEGNEVVATWTGERLPNDATIRLFADSDGQGTDGVEIGSAALNRGTVRIPLQDTTVPCQFHVYALVVHPAMSAAVYADGEFANPTATLPIPMGVQAASTADDVTTITFSPVADPRVSAVAVYDAVTGENLGTAYPFEGRLVLTVPGHAGRALRLASVSVRGNRSCLSEPVSIVTGVDEESVRITDGSMSMHISPNPVVDGARVVIAGSHGVEAVSMRLVDARGATVYTTALELDADARAEVLIPTTGLPMGAYTVIIKARNGVLAKNIVVVH